MEITVNGYTITLEPKLTMRILREVRGKFLEQIQAMLGAGGEGTVRLGVSGLIEAAEYFVRRMIKQVKDPSGKIVNKDAWLDDMTPQEYEEISNAVYEAYELSVDDLFDMLLQGVGSKKK